MVGGGLALSANFQSPRDPGGLLPMGTEATMGEDPTGTFASEEDSEISFQNSQRVPPPPTPTRVMAASPQVMALLAGFPPPPPPETPPPSRRRRSKSTPRVSNSKSSSSELPSEVRFSSAENQTDIGTASLADMPASNPTPVPFPFKAVVDDSVYAEQPSHDGSRLAIARRRLSAISLDPPAGSPHFRRSIQPHNQATPRLIAAAGQENKSPERMNGLLPQRSPVSDVTEPTSNQHPHQGGNPLTFEAMTSLPGSPYLGTSEIGRRESDFDDGSHQHRHRSKSSDRKHRPKTPERLRRVLSTGLAGSTHKRSHTGDVDFPSRNGVDMRNRTPNHRRNQTTPARVEFTNRLVQNGSSKLTDIQIPRESSNPTSNSSFAHTVSTGVTSGKSLGSESASKKTSKYLSSIKAPKRTFFQKLFGGKRKMARDQEVSEAMVQGNPQRISIASHMQTSQSTTSGMVLEKQSEDEKVPLVLPRNTTEPRDEDHEYERGSVFFAHDEVSTLTAPTMESYYYHRDPTEENERVSEPLGHHWSNFGGDAVARDDTGFPSIDPFTAPFFQEPSGASPVPKTASFDLRIHVPHVSDPIGESPLNSIKAKPLKHSQQPPLHDPSPRGFKNTLPFSEDPVGESPLHKHERGPTALIDGNPYAPDPPLYLVALENESSSNLESDSPSGGHGEENERDIVPGLASRDSPSVVPPVTPLLPPRPPSPRVTSQSLSKSSPRCRVASPVMINPLASQAIELSSTGTRNNSIASKEIESEKSDCVEPKAVVQNDEIEPAVVSTPLPIPTDTENSPTSHAKLPSSVSSGPVDSDEVLRLVATSSNNSLLVSDAEDSPSNSLASRPADDRHSPSLVRAGSFESTDSQSKRSIRAKAFLKKSRSRSKSRAAVPKIVTSYAETKTIVDFSSTAQDSSPAFSVSKDKVPETPSPRRFSPRAALKARALANKKLDAGIDETTGEENSAKGKSKHLTVSSAARMNAKAVAYLHTISGDASPSHGWRRSDDSEDEPSPKLRSSTTTVGRKVVPADGNVSAPPKQADCLAPGSVHVFSPYSEKFKGRGLNKKDSIKTSLTCKAPVEKPDTRALTASTRTEVNPLRRDTSIHPVAVYAGLRLLRKRRDRRIECGQATKVTPVRKVKTPRVQSYFGPLCDPEPKDPIQRAGRRLLAKSAVPVQAAARRFLAKRAAVDRMWALLELQSYFRRWRAEAAFVAARSSATAIQRVFRGGQRRRMFLSQREAAVQIQKIVRGYIYAIRVYEDVFRIIRIQARARSVRCRRDFTSQKSSTLRIQTAYRAYRSRQLLNKRLRGVTNIQAQWRAYLIRTCFQFVVVDIIITQSVVRRWLARKQYICTLARKRVDAASRIQSQFKGYHTRLTLKRDKSACKMQASWRCYRQKTKYRQYCSAKAIQAIWRGYCTLALYRSHCAARKIQSSWRRSRDLGHYREYKAAKRIQAAYQGARYRKQYTRRRAATRIQAAWRGFQGYTDYVFTLVDVLVIQRSIRRWRAKTEVVRMRRENAALRVQSRWRSHKARLHLLVNLMRIILVQSIIRRYLCQAIVANVKQERIEKGLGATKIQAAWRGFWQYSHYVILRFETVRLQSLFRRNKAHMNFILSLGCCIVIQSKIRQFLAQRRMQGLVAARALLHSESQGLREHNASKRIQFFWRVVLECRKEKKAALVIERFFLMVKAEVDKEIRKAKEKKTTKRRRSARSHNFEYDSSLDQKWIESLNDEELAIFSFSRSKSSDSIACRKPLTVGHSVPRPSPSTNQHDGKRSPASKGPLQKGTVRHRASSPTLNLVLRHDHAPRDTVLSASSSNSHVVVRESAQVGRHRLSLDAQSASRGDCRPLSVEKHQTLYGIHTAPYRSSKDRHFFKESGERTENCATTTPKSTVSGPTSTKSEASSKSDLGWQRFLLDQSSVEPSISGESIREAQDVVRATQLVTTSPRHGKILIMNPYPELAPSSEKVTGSELIETDYLGEDFGLI